MRKLKGLKENSMLAVFFLSACFSIAAVAVICIFLFANGPSGCGKSTLLRVFNRMNDLTEGCRTTGEVTLDGEDIFRKGMDVSILQKKVGMVFQKPNPFPMGVYGNVAYGPRTHGVRGRARLDDIAERALTDAAVWDEAKDSLKKTPAPVGRPAAEGMHRKALAVEPEALLMDEPASALDPISAAKIEELVSGLKKEYTIVIVTHNMQQAARVSDKTAFFLLGDLVEYGETESIFLNPGDRRTEDYKYRGK